MKKLGERIRVEMERLGKNSKAVASAAHDHLVAQLGSGADKLDTVTGKLSKLLNDKPEGAAYFYALDRSERLEALAHTLCVDAPTLQEWRRQDEVPTLVLDPRLPAEAIRFISLQADNRSAMYRVVVVERPTGSTDDAAVETAIRAELAQHAESIAVVATPEAKRMFMFAERSVTMLHPVPRGYVLDEFPELVPIPAPAQPRRFDEAGLPILPLLDPIRTKDPHEPFRRELDEIEQRVIAPATARGEVPCLSVKDAIVWNTRTAGPFLPARRAGGYGSDFDPSVKLCAARSVRVAQLVGDDKATTHVWIEGQRIFALGPQLSAVAAMFSPHHEVIEPQDLVSLRARILETQPWQLLEEAERTEDPLYPLLAELKPWAVARQAERISALAKRNEDEPARHVPEVEVATRDRLRALASYGAASKGCALLFALDRAADAPLLTFDNRHGAAHGDLSVLADLGGGRLIRIRTMKLSGQRAPFVERSSSASRMYEVSHYANRPAVYDGGDVLMSVEWTIDTNLEGWAPQTRRRRAMSDSYSDDD